jgi:putative DNA primase/helicase
MSTPLLANSQVRPQALTLRVDNIPEMLRSLPRWVVWKYVPEADPETGAIEWNKPPSNAQTGRLASSTNSATWATFDLALGVYQRGGWDGLGFVLHRTADAAMDGLIGIDLDKCRDPQTKVLDPWACDIVDRLASYAEVSPSGRGVRIFVLGKLPPRGRKKGPFEVYETGRYVTVTGQHIEGTPGTIEYRQEELQDVHRQVFGEAVCKDGEAPRPTTTLSLNDAELIQKASEAKNGDKFRRLWEGDTSGYGSRSEADAALANHLAFWTGGDFQRVVDLFAQSGLARSKWNRPDYQRRTFDLAMRGRGPGDFYDPTPNGHHGSEQHKGNGQPKENDHGSVTTAPVANEAGDDPHRLARLFVADQFQDGLPTVRFWRGEWYRWDGAYHLLPEKELRAEVCRRVKAEFDRLNSVATQLWEKAGRVDDKGKPCPAPAVRPVTTKKMGDVLQALTSLTVLPGSVVPPTWLRGSCDFTPAEILACRNGLIHLPSLVAGREYRVPLTPRFFGLNVLDYDFDEFAPSPQEWLRFLNEVWPDDPEAIETLQEVFGYLLLPDTRQHKVFLIVGPKRSGKGTIGRVLSRLVGKANVCGLTLSGLASHFGLWPLIGKMLGIISDARLSGRTDTAVVVERLLSISGEDDQTIDRKNLEPVTCRLPIRFVLMTNELPRLTDASGALPGRMIVLRMTKSWYGKEDTCLTDRLLEELPGILSWSIVGWQRLQERGHLVQPKSGMQMAQDMADLSSPVGAFVRERCLVGPGHEIPVEDLYQSWKGWCEAKGRQPGSEQTFGRDLRAAVPSIDDRRPRENGERVRKYVGIRLRRLEDADASER